MAQGTLERGSKTAEKTINEFKEELEILKVQDFVTYDKMIWQIAQWAGGAMDEKRSEFHPGKSDEDFMRLLDDLGEDLLSGTPPEEKSAA